MQYGLLCDQVLCPVLGEQMLSAWGYVWLPTVGVNWQTLKTFLNDIPRPLQLWVLNSTAVGMLLPQWRNEVESG